MAMLRRVLLLTTTGTFQRVNVIKAEKGCNRQHTEFHDGAKLQVILDLQSIILLDYLFIKKPGLIIAGKQL